jgi:repressor LexA
MESLTTKQQKALEYIRQHTSRFGYAPTLRELCDYMGYRAIGSAQDVIASLRRKGYLQVPNKQTARSLILSEQARRHERPQPVRVSNQDSISVPCLGAVPAGKPQEAIEDNIGHIEVSRSLLPKPMPPKDQLFALRAQGHSMIGAGILDRDWLIVRSQTEANPGSIVVARSGEEATVKRLMRDDERGWFLKPENPAFPSVYASEEPFEIIGRVIALQRSFEP